MTVTTLPDLIARAESLARGLRFSDEPTTTEQWNTFEATAHRLMRALVDAPVNGRRPGAADPLRSREIVRALPRAAMFSGAQTSYTAREAGAQLGISGSTVLKRVRRSDLPAVLDAGTYVIRAEDLFGGSELTPANASSAHPLDRLSTMLGTAGDLILLHRQRQGPGVQGDPLSSEAQVAPAMTRVLTLTLAAARDSASRLPLATTDQALALAKYAERSLDQLNQLNERVDNDSLSRVATFMAEPTRRGHNGGLQSVLRSWAESAHAEVRRDIPSADSLRAIANQGLHVYAVTARMLDASEPGAVDARDFQDLLREAAEHQRRLQEQWGNVTTAMKPRREFALATREFHSALERLDGKMVDAKSDSPLRDVDRITVGYELANALGEIADLSHEARHLPDLLAQSELLFAPARILPSTTDRLRARHLGRFVPVLGTEAEDLRLAANYAADAAATVLRNVTPTLQATRGEVTRYLVPISHGIAPEL